MTGNGYPKDEDYREAFRTLIENAVYFFKRLERVAEDIHQEGEKSGPRRGILSFLVREGAQTVPSMARHMHVTRQFVQLLVNAMVDEGLLELIPNPAHKRSRLVSITEAGAERVERMFEVENALMDFMELDISREELLQAASLISKVRDAFTTDEFNTHLRMMHETANSDEKK